MRMVEKPPVEEEAVKYRAAIGRVSDLASSRWKEHHERWMKDNGVEGKQWWR
jgi:hypothetical protein